MPRKLENSMIFFQIFDAQFLKAISLKDTYSL
jgi:hypothetical protein